MDCRMVSTMDWERLQQQVDGLRITRDLESDLEDAEPENRLIAVNGFIFNGGNGARVDNIALYNPKEVTYLSDAKEVSKVDINNS